MCGVMICCIRALRALPCCLTTCERDALSSAVPTSQCADDVCIQEMSSLYDSFMSSTLMCFLGCISVQQCDILNAARA
jgi:hypothetical protein